MTILADFARVVSQASIGAILASVVTSSGMLPESMNHLSGAEFHRLARLAAVALLVAAVCNGANFYGQRVGLIDRQIYRAFWDWHCDGFDANAPKDSIERRHLCESLRSDGTEARAEARQGRVRTGLVGLSLLLIARRRAVLPRRRDAWPVQILFADAMLGFVASLLLNGGWIAATGLRSFMFIAVALLCGWLAPHLTLFAKCVGVLLAIELPLIGWELFHGMHLYRHWTSLDLAARASGLMDQPNSLGIFAVCARAFYYSFSASTAWLAPLFLAALAIAIFSGSATGIVGLGLLGFLILWARTTRERRLFVAAAAMVLLPVLVLGLPELPK